MALDRCAVQINLAFRLVIVQEFKSTKACRLVILSKRWLSQAKKSARIWDGFFAVYPVVLILSRPLEEWQGLVINIAVRFTKKMVIPMNFRRRSKSQPLSSPCLKPEASRSFYGD